MEIIPTIYTLNATRILVINDQTLFQWFDYEFPRGIDPLWIPLILDCLNDDFNSRPDFKSICKTILKISRKKTMDKNKFNEYKKLFMNYEPFQNQLEIMLFHIVYH